MGGQTDKEIVWLIEDHSKLWNALIALLVLFWAIRVASQVLRVLLLFSFCEVLSHSRVIGTIPVTTSSVLATS